MGLVFISSEKNAIVFAIMQARGGLSQWLNFLVAWFMELQEHCPLVQLQELGHVYPSRYLLPQGLGTCHLFL